MHADTRELVGGKEKELHHGEDGGVNLAAVEVEVGQWWLAEQPRIHSRSQSLWSR